MRSERPNQAGDGLIPCAMSNWSREIRMNNFTNQGMQAYEEVIDREGRDRIATLDNVGSLAIDDAVLVLPSQMEALEVSAAGGGPYCRLHCRQVRRF